MRSIWILLAAVLTTTIAFSQTITNVDVFINPSLQERGELAWTGTPLTWDHFRGRPDRSCNFIAMTYSGIKLKYSWATRRGITSARIEVCPYMDLEQSWHKKDHCNDTTLEHEQRHFDITALVTSQFMNELKQHEFTVRTLPGELKKLHEHYLSELARRQAEYDNDTVHGTIREKQEYWNRTITAAVSALPEG